MTRFDLAGAFTALVTPFNDDASEIDFAAFEALVDGQIKGSISGLVPCGTTGETPTLSDAEQRDLIRRTRDLAGGKVPILAGTGSNSTRDTIDASRAAVEAGADAVMVVMPYYNKPSQEGMIRHVELVSKAVPAPIVLYNIPGRCGVELSVESMLRILDLCPNVVGVKDATGNVLWAQELLGRAGDRASVVSGDDVLTLPLMSIGARGIISVTSNLYPRQVSDTVGDVLAGRWSDALRKHRALFPVHRALFVEPNPQPIKAALAMKGRMRASVRPPLIEASAGCRETLASVLAAYEAS